MLDVVPACCNYLQSSSFRFWFCGLFLLVPVCLFPFLGVVCYSKTESQRQWWWRNGAIETQILWCNCAMMVAQWQCHSYIYWRIHWGNEGGNDEKGASSHDPRDSAVKMHRTIRRDSYLDLSWDRQRIWASWAVVVDPSPIARTPCRPRSVDFFVIRLSLPKSYSSILAMEVRAGVQLGIIRTSKLRSDGFEPM